MPPVVTFQTTDFSQRPFEPLARPIIELLDQLPDGLFEDVFDALAVWGTISAYQRSFDRWSVLFLPEKDKQGSWDQLVHTTLQGFYEAVTDLGLRGVTITLPGGSCELVDNPDRALDKSRAEVLEQYAREARRRFYPAHEFGSNCVVLIDGKQALREYLDLDVAGWRHATGEGEAMSCKSKARLLQVQGLIRMADLKSRLLAQFGRDGLVLYLTAMDHTDMVNERLADLADHAPNLDIGHYVAIGSDRLRKLKQDVPYRYLSA